MSNYCQFSEICNLYMNFKLNFVYKTQQIATLEIKAQSIAFITKVSVVSITFFEMLYFL